MERFVFVLLALAALAGATEEEKGWKCPEIDDSCRCNQPHTLRCDGPGDRLNLIIESLERNNAEITLLDLSLHNVTVLKKDVFGPEFASKVKTLTGLVISSGHLRTVEAGAFSGIRGQLRAIGLPDNSLHSIPRPLTLLRSLRRLDLSKNYITNFKPFEEPVKRSTSALIYLDLSFNVLSNISNLVQLPRTLVTLKLQNNKLTLEDLSKIRINQRLQSISLAFNDLRGQLTFEAFNIQPNATLSSLDLSSNHIRKISRDPFRKLQSIQTLRLNRNEIDILDIRSFMSVTNLSFLDLSHNRIVELTSGVFEPLTSLTHLDLSHNHLQVLDSGTTLGLVRLSYLDLEDNEIIKVEKNSLIACHSLTTLILTGTTSVAASK